MYICKAYATWDALHASLPEGVWQKGFEQAHLRLTQAAR